MISKSQDFLRFLKHLFYFLTDFKEIFRYIYGIFNEFLKSLEITWNCLPILGIFDKIFVWSFCESVQVFFEWYTRCINYS